MSSSAFFPQARTNSDYSPSSSTPTPASHLNKRFFAEISPFLITTSRINPPTYNYGNQRFGLRSVGLDLFLPVMIDAHTPLLDEKSSPFFCTPEFSPTLDEGLFRHLSFRCYGVLAMSDREKYDINCRNFREELLLPLFGNIKEKTFKFAKILHSSTWINHCFHLEIFFPVIFSSKEITTLKKVYQGLLRLLTLQICVVHQSRQSFEIISTSELLLFEDLIPSKVVIV